MYQQRIEMLTQWMKEENIDMAVFSDFEEHRDSAVRYFTGQPSDAVVCIARYGLVMIAAWDINLAYERAQADIITAFSHFARNTCNVIASAAQTFGFHAGCRIEISESTPYPEFLRFVEKLEPFDVVCRSHGVDAFVSMIRAVKSDDEIKIIRSAAAVTNTIIDDIEKKLKNGQLRTEYEVAAFVEQQALNAGCEGLGFETLAAGPVRSCCIHAFPPYTAGEFGTQGFSLLDFGVVLNGYTTDVTLTVAGGKLTAVQQRQLDLVMSAYAAALELYRPDQPVRAAAKKVNALFSRGKCSMPHALGHSIGLDAHEVPVVKDAAGNDWKFKPGMVCALEPGLYNPNLGGCRFENDILITAAGNEVLTESRVIYL